MSKAKKKTVKLPVFFFIAAASAAAALLARVPAAEVLKPHLGKITFVSRETFVYAAIFSLSFIALTLASRLRPQWREKAGDLAPRIARAFLAAFVFMAPLVALQIQSAEKKASLDTLFGPAQKKPQTGYAKSDRDKLDALMEETHGTP